MKNKIDIKSLVLGAVLSAVVVLGLGAAGESSQVKASDWEYRSLQTYTTQNFDLKINELAKDGWFVVSSSTSQTETSSSPYAVVILKRPRQSQ